MKNFRILILAILMASPFVFQNCGPVIISSRPNSPPPSWFYPNRLETLRYVYFPDLLIYYDLTLRNYIYLDNGVWITASVLPTRFNSINLRRSRTVRINNYFGDNIRRYHAENRISNNRRNTTTRRRSN